MKKVLFAAGLLLVFGTVGKGQDRSLPDAPVPKVQDPGPAHSNPSQFKDPYWEPHYTVCWVKDSKTSGHYEGCWVHHRVNTKHFWGMVVLMGGGAYAHHKGGDICRENGRREGCTSNYGAFEATEITNSIISVGAGTMAYYFCRKDFHNAKWCDLVPSTVVGLNVGWGVHEGLINNTKPRD